MRLPSWLAANGVFRWMTFLFHLMLHRLFKAHKANSRLKLTQAQHLFQEPDRDNPIRQFHKQKDILRST